MTGNPQVLAITAGALIAYRADLLTVSSDSPLPPGSRVRLELSTRGEQRLILVGKVVGIDRAESGDHYLLKVRLHSLPRTDRAVLEALVAGAGDDGVKG